MVDRRSHTKPRANGRRDHCDADENDEDSAFAFDWLRHVLLSRGSRIRRTRKKDQEQKGADDGAAVSEHFVDWPDSRERKFDDSMEKMPMLVWPVLCVRKPIPENVREDADEDGEHKDRELRGSAGGQGSRSESYFSARAFGQPRPERLFGIFVKQPEDRDGDREIKSKDAGEGVAES